MGREAEGAFEGDGVGECEEIEEVGRLEAMARPACGDPVMGA